jgi:hypothetical protein
MTDEEGERLGGPMRRFLLGLACGVALAGLVLGGLVAFTDLRLTTETTQDVAQRLLQASPPVERGSSTSSFKFTRTVPMLRGKPLRDATGFLRRAGFKPHVKNFCAPCSSMPVVVRQSPSPGTRVAKGDEVLLTVDTPAPGSQRTPHRPPGGPWTECDQIRSFPGEGGARGRSAFRSPRALAPTLKRFFVTRTMCAHAGAAEGLPRVTSMAIPAS